MTQDNEIEVMIKGTINVGCLKDTPDVESISKVLAKQVQILILKSRVEELERITWKGEPIIFTNEGIAIKNRINELNAEIKELEG